MKISPEVRLAVLTGFMGSFTTFSSFMYDTWALRQDQQWLKASLKFLTHNAVGFSSFAGGVVQGRWL